MGSGEEGKQWYFGMKAQIGVDLGTGYTHTVTATAANMHHLEEAASLVRDDDEVVYADASYQGAASRPAMSGDEHRSRVEWRIAARKRVLKTMTEFDRVIELRKAAVRAKVEHPFLITSYRLRAWST